MRDKESDRHQRTNFQQKLSLGNPEGALARQDQQYQPVGKNTVDPGKTRNGKKEGWIGNTLTKPVASTMRHA